MFYSRYNQFYPHTKTFGVGVYLLLLTFFTLLSFPTYTLAANTVIGKLSVVQGMVAIQRLGVVNTLKAGAEDKIFIGDVLQTGKGSGAQITFIDDSFVNLSSETKLRVDQYIYEPDNNRRKAIIKSLDGKTPPSMLTHEQRKLFIRETKVTESPR